MPLAPPPYMLAAALIPLIFILGLLALFVFGAWDVGVFPGLVIAALLGFIAVALVRMTYQLGPPKHAK